MAKKHIYRSGWNFFKSGYILLHFSGWFLAQFSPKKQKFLTYPRFDTICYGIDLQFIEFERSFNQQLSNHNQPKRPTHNYVFTYDYFFPFSSTKGQELGGDLKSQWEIMEVTKGIKLIYGKSKITQVDCYYFANAHGSNYKIEAIGYIINWGTRYWAKT